MSTTPRRGQPPVPGDPELSVQEMQRRVAVLRQSRPLDAQEIDWRNEMYENEWWQCISPIDGGISPHPIYHFRLKVGESPICPACGSQQAWERRDHVEKPDESGITVP